MRSKALVEDPHQVVLLRGELVVSSQGLRSTGGTLFCLKDTHCTHFKQCGRFTGMDLREQSEWVPKTIRSGIKVVFWYACRFSKTQKETYTLLSASCLLAHIVTE